MGNSFTGRYGLFPGYGTHTLATHISIIKKKEFDDILAGNAGYLRGSVVNTSDTPSTSSVHRLYYG